MRRYRWPEFDIRLLGELQKQQNNTQFCDTLLQTEGISVPAHSCILAALSPYLSQKLSASSSPPLGQKRQLQLQAVKAQTLLKLVGLLYSGELEVEGGVEQNDVLSAACQFGITGLVEGQNDGGMKERELQKKSFGSCGERNESRTMQDAQVQAEMAGRRDTDFPIEKRSYVSTGTQTVKAGEKTVGCSFTHSGQTKPPTPEPASSLSQSLGFFTPLQPQNITQRNMFEKHVCSTYLPPIPSIPIGTPTDGEPTVDRSSDSVTNPKSTSPLSSNALTVSISLNAESNASTPQEDSTYQRPPGFGDSALAKEGTGLEEGNMADNGENGEQSRHANKGEMLKGNSAEKRHAHANVGRKSLAKMKRMQQMMETTQISIKVKLRRRTKGEAWEVVGVQDTDETLSLLTSWKQEHSNHKRSQTDLTNGEPPPSLVQPGQIHKPILQPATTNSPEPPPHPNATSDITPKQYHDLESVPLPQPPGPAQESDEQIEKLLEDIMMGLNILPNLEVDCNKSHHQPSHSGAPSVCQVPVQDNDGVQSPMHAAVRAEGCVCYQDFDTRIGYSSADTGIHCCAPAQNQPSCSSLSSVQADAVLIRQLQRSPPHHSSVTSTGQRHGMSHQDMPLSKSQNCPYPEAPTTKLVLPLAFYSSGQRLHYPVCQDLSSQDDQNSLDFLFLTNGNEAQSSHSFSLPCMDDVRLPRCLSPLEPSTSVAKHQPILSNSTNHSDKIQPQPPLRGRPWLTEIPGSLQFPLDAITHRENKCAASPQDTNRSCLSNQRPLNPQHGGTWAESCTLKEVEERGALSAGHQNATDLKSDRRNVREGSKCQPGNAAAPKRRTTKHKNHPQAACSLLACQDVKVNVTQSKIKLSLCSVSLSSNNVLMTDREMDTNPSSNIPNKHVGNTSEPSLTIAESLRRKTRGPGDPNSDQTRIRTRGFLKKSRDTPINASLDNSSVLKPMVCRVESIHKQEVSAPRRKRGRPPKRKLEKSPPVSFPAITEKMSHNVESEQQIANNMPKEEEEECETSKRRRRRNRGDVPSIPLKKTIGADNTEADADNNNKIIPAGKKLGTPKRPPIVTVKQFQKFIESQHSKPRRSNKSQDKETDERETLTKGTDMDITQSQNRDGTESHVLSSDTIDENHNWMKSTADYSKPQPPDTNSSTSKETSYFGEEYHPVCFLDVCGEDVAKLAADGEQPLKNPDEAQKSCDAGMSDTVKHNVDRSRQCCGAHLPQEDKTPLYHNLSPQTHQTTGPPLSDAAGFTKSSGCDQEEEEDEDVDVDVDILLCSPDKVPQTIECDNGLDNMAITPEEEEEEDVSEIDVTGE